VFDPHEIFKVGEVVYVVLTSGVRSSLGIPLDRGYAWSFTTRVVCGSGIYSLDSIYSYETHSGFGSDLDGDGDIDLATVSSGDRISVFVNNGDATFAPPFEYQVGDGPHALFAADLDGDHDIDLVTQNWNDDSISVLFNNGDGFFASPITYPGGHTCHSIFAVDLDNDGDIDIATANRYSNDVHILLNDGTGGFAAPSSFYGGGIWPMDIYSADFDNDWDFDLTTVTGSGNPSVDDRAVILWNDGTASFDDRLYNPIAKYPNYNFAADFNGDNYVDIVTTSGTLPGSLCVIINNGDGTFLPRSVYLSSYDYVHSCGVHAADLDGDGDVDLVNGIVSYTDGLSIHLNNGDGTFAPQTIYSFPGGDGIVTADFDCDGDLDLVLTGFNIGFSSVRVLLNQGGHRRGDANGDGVIDLGDVLHLINYLYKGGPAPDPLGTGDVNCDEVIDLGDVLHLINYLYKAGPPPNCC